MCSLLRKHSLLRRDLRLQTARSKAVSLGYAQHPLGQHVLQSLLSLQVIAGLRCRKNKTVFLLGTLMGHRWASGDLFTSEAGARPEANAILSSMTTFLQKSSSIANRYKLSTVFLHYMQRSRTPLPSPLGGYAILPHAKERECQ